MFSVSLLYSTQDFLKLTPEAGMTPDQFKSHFKKFKYSTAENILDLSFKCGWSKLTKVGIIELTDRGRIITNTDYKTGLLHQLQDMILNFNPVWASILLKGRTEAKNFLPPEVSQCFRESGMFDELNDELIKFWDKLTLAYRNYSQKRMTEIGREGERLSFHYEWERIGSKPIWQAIESNLAGYDILSFKDAGQTEKLQIEVKSSTSELNYAMLHITRHEWQTAANSQGYIFHLWLLRDTPTLFEITMDKMELHIPKNNGCGQWESVEIPFSAVIS